MENNENKIIEVNEETTNVQVIQEQQTNILETAKMLSESTIVPVSYQHRPENCYIALEIANRMNTPVIAIMQNLYVVQGKPVFSGSACASMVQNNPKLCDVELVYVGKEGTDDWGAYVTAKNKRTGKVIKGSTVTIGTAKAEGWYNKNGSKWKTMPEMMLGYRAFAWFARLHCPDVLMGFQTVEEAEDISSTQTNSVANPYNK